MYERERETERETRSDFQIFSLRGGGALNCPAINYWPWYITTWLLYWALHLPPSLIYVHTVSSRGRTRIHICATCMHLMCTFMYDNINISKRRTPSELLKLPANVRNCRMLTFTMLYMMRDILINDQAQWCFITFHINDLIIFAVWFQVFLTFCNNQL